MVLHELYDLNGIGFAKAESLISGLKAYPPPRLVFLLFFFPAWDARSTRPKGESGDTLDPGSGDCGSLSGNGSAAATAGGAAGAAGGAAGAGGAGAGSTLFFFFK